ncbi:GTPase Era, mitochondrial isoform X2 [Eurosta solidaginis]|uniref:GTPase Era, mitochondrial isoform X2 n=2 Tax=Eurosta solidaginis TaxID=178769 RepID=UPI0035316B2C
MEVMMNKFVSPTIFKLKIYQISGVWITNKLNYSLAAVSGSANPEKPSASQTVSGHVTEKTQNKQLNQNSLHVAVIGVPNAGKSTFINNLINHRVCPTSSKVHTTRKANKAISTTGHTQLIFYDTPGLVTPNEMKRYHLEQNFNKAYRHAIQHADVIACMHDVSNSWTRNVLHSTVLETLKEYHHFPSFLVLNKIDMLKSKRVLLDLIRILTNNTISTAQLKGNRKRKFKTNSIEKLNASAPTITGKDKGKEGSWSNFQKVFLVSSITGNGLGDIHSYLTSIAKDRSWDYAKEMFTDETPEELIVESVRARLLDYLPQEIPYNLQSAIEYYSEENGKFKKALEKNGASTHVKCMSDRVVWRLFHLRKVI